jgi:hypothetical protein
VGFEPTIPAGERPQTYALDPRGPWDRQTKILIDKINFNLNFYGFENLRYLRTTRLGKYA